jgi:2',3'-cyclic-nucleotide 2'-phosphodiesterase (5'-nucleotidase family)
MKCAVKSLPRALSASFFRAHPVGAESLTVLHIGDQESWLISAQGKLRDNASQGISFYGGVDRLASVIAARKAAAPGTVTTLNAGDSFLPGPRLNASFVDLATAHPDGGQDFYDAIASRRIGFDATTFDNHEFDLDNTRMIRVSGAAADADKVTPDATLNATVVTPVLNYVAALNAQVIGSTATRLNGPTHASCTPVAPATTCQYTEGVRNAETGMGNLVADAMRFAGQTDVAIQNGGGIRASLGVPGNVTVGDTFNILTFTKLVKRAPVMNATQFKDILEHAVGAASATGAANGKFAQISGMQVIYDTRKTARSTVVTDVGSGDRVRRVVLDDGSVLIDNGVVVDPVRSFSFTTIDFTANGGANYPFAANGVVFENNPFAITYQEALAKLISTPKAAGGLQRIDAADGDEITVNLYGEENAFDRYGRLIDLNDGYVRVVDVTGGISLQIDTDGAFGPVALRPLATLKGLTARQFAPARDLSQ